MLNLFMYGSCVSRDTYDFFSRDECKLLGYVSRQSVISAFRPASASVLDKATMSSPFQLRNSTGDFQGDLLQRLDEEGGGADVIVWDIVDERNGIVETSDGGYITYTYDLHRANVFNLMQENGSFVRRINFGSDEHFIIWCKSVDEFIRQLKLRDLGDRLLLLVAPWATETDEGGLPNTWSQGPSIDEANERYKRYYDYVATVHNVPTVSLLPKEATTKKSHKWGPAPYHYTDAAYLYYRRGIERFATSVGGRAVPNMQR